MCKELGLTPGVGSPLRIFPVRTVAIQNPASGVPRTPLARSSASKHERLTASPAPAQSAKLLRPAGRRNAAQEVLHLCGNVSGWPRTRIGKGVRSDKERPFATLRDRCDYVEVMTGLSVSRSTMCRAIARIGPTRKKGDELPPSATISRERPGG